MRKKHKKGIIWFISFIFYQAVQGVPVGHADIALTVTNTAVAIPVLLNDEGSSGGVLELAAIETDPQHGTLSFDSDGVVYTPNDGFEGIDRFSYTLVEVVQGVESEGVAVAVEVAVNEALDVEATRDALLDGVNGIYSGGLPTPIYSYGPSSLVVTRYGAELDSGAMVVASTLGAGRVVAVPYGMPDIEWHKDKAESEVFFKNMLKWLQGGSVDKSVRIKTRIGQIRDWLVREGYTNVTHINGNFTAALVEDTDLILGHIGTGVSASGVAAIVEALSNGMGLYVAEFGLGYDWWWSRELWEVPINQVLEYSGVIYAKDWYKAEKIYAIERPSENTGYLSFESQLAVVEDSASATVEDKAHTMDCMPVLLRGLDLNSLMRARLIASSKAGYQSLMPSRTNPIDDAFDKFLLEMESDVLQREGIDEIEKHRMADTWYGAVPDDADRSHKVVELDLERARWRPLGMYAPPGEVVTLEFPAELVGRGYRVLVSPHADDITRRAVWYRIPEVQRSYAMDTSTLEVGSAFGGSLFVDLGETIPGGGTVQVGVSGAVEQAYFILGKHRNSDWNTELKHRPAPYGIIEGPSFILHDRMDLDPYAKGKDLVDAEHLAGFWNRMVEMEDWLNTKFENGRTYAELMNRDYQISAGYAHAGYPYQVEWNWVPDPFDVEFLRKRGAWGDFHEVGHNHQDGWWTRTMETEVTVNVFSNYIMEALVTDSTEWSVVPAQVWSRALGAHEAGESYEAMDVWERLCFYLILADQFGWEAFHEFYGSYRADNKDNPDALPSGDAEELDQVLTRFSRIVGRDISPFMNDYGMFPSTAAKDAVSDLEGWNPFDLYVVPDALNPEIGSTIQVHVYVPEATTSVSLEVDGVPVALNAVSSKHYSCDLVCDTLGAVMLEAVLDNGLKETQTVTVVAVDVDVDDDGMTDTWEAAHDLNTLWDDTALDWDKDGLSNLEEFIAGSDPQDLGSFFKTTLENMDGTTLSLSCPSIAGRSYQLYRSDDLIDWVPYGAAQNSNPPKNSFAIPMDPSEGDKFFYRIEVSQ